MTVTGVGDSCGFAQLSKRDMRDVSTFPEFRKRGSVADRERLVRKTGCYKHQGVASIYSALCEFVAYG